MPKNETIEVEVDFTDREAVDALEKEAATARFATFDIETGPVHNIEELIPWFDPPELPGDFDPKTVAIGNLKDQAKIDAKIEAARAKHVDAVTNYAATYADALAAHREKFISNAALSPLTGRVLAAGILRLDQFFIWTAETEAEEAELLSNVWGQMLDFRDKTLVGFCIENFDLPFLITRSRLLGVRVPQFVRPDITRRYYSPLFIDLQLVWTLGDPKAFVKLNTVASHLKAGQKSGDGADFATTFFADRPSAIEYLKTDLSLTRRVGWRLGIR